MPDVHVTNCQFSPPMIRALRAGDKTQDRRLPAAKWTKLYDRYEAGDQCFMYVQERHFAHPKGYMQDRFCRYYASDEGLANATWRPPMHMRREWSRMTLSLTDARCEYLQRIDATEAIAEGIEHVEIDGLSNPMLTSRLSFSMLWDELHQEYGTTWAESPLVYAFTFRVIGCNIDTYLKEKGLA